MDDDIQCLVVEGAAVAKALNAKYVPQTEMVPVDFAAAGIRNPVIWLEKPNVKVRGPEAALSPEAPARLPGSAAGNHEAP